MTTTVRKAHLYLTDGARLLVHRHVDLPFEIVGVQIPGGTVRAEETPKAAALRECAEETGRIDFTLVRKLGVYRYDITPHRPELQIRHVYEARPLGAWPDRWRVWERNDAGVQADLLELFWIPLAQAHVLQAGHGTLIGRLLR